MKPFARASLVILATFVALLMIAPGAALADTTQNGLKIDWHRAHFSGLGQAQGIPGGAYANGTFVVSTYADKGGRIWASSDARNWSLVWSGADTPGPIVAGGPGFVAWSRGVLLSANGHNWTRANQGVPQKLLNADFVQLGSVGGMVVAFPGRGHGYWSADGRNWHSIFGGPEQLITLAGDGAGLWALTGGHNFNTGVRSPVKVWTTTNGKNWTDSAQLPHSDRAVFLSAAFGSIGGVVIGEGKSWYSTDDIHWHVATNTPTVTSKGYMSVDAVVADPSGFIVAGHRDPPGCVVDPAQRRALTWTSVDGKVWRRMSSTGFLGKEIDQLFITGRTLYGIGVNWAVNNENGAGAVWHAALPPLASDNAPPPAPVPNPGPQGC